MQRKQKSIEEEDEDEESDISSEGDKKENERQVWVSFLK